MFSSRSRVPGQDLIDRLVRGAGGELLRTFWHSPFPVTLQDARHRFVAVNDAFVAFAGHPRDVLVGADPLDFAPAEDREALRAARRPLPRSAGLSRAEAPPLLAQRLVDGQGRERWYRAAHHLLDDGRGQRLLLAVLQDVTAEHQAREQVDRSLRELEQWFALSPVGMLMYDRHGLVVRSNRAFDLLVPALPVALPDGDPALAQLLGWGEDGADARLQPGGPGLERSARLPGRDGLARLLHARVRAIEPAPGQARYLAVVEDRSAQDERDLAQLEAGAMADAAGVGVATYEPSLGWLRSTIAAAPEGRASGLQAISRELVEPASRAEYERLQQALRHGERAEVRYAVRHPELGQRWLLTRVEPGQLGPGRRASSVVTLDVTEQEAARLRGEELLRELSTILDSTSAGIGYLRDGVLVRCNARFEAMLGLQAGRSPGVALATLLAGRPVLAEFEAALSVLRAGGRHAEREFRAGTGNDAGWLSLSLRRAERSDAGEALDAVVVLGDISHLKAQQAQLERLLGERQCMTERTRAVLDSVLVGIVTVGERGIEWMNRSARRMFGGELADFLGAPIATVAPAADVDHPLRRTHYLATLAEGQSEAFECRLAARDGREFWVVGNAVATGDGQITFALLDIERRRQAELRIAQAQASLQRVIETAPMAIGLVDAATLRLRQLNQMAAMLVGRSIEAALGCTPHELFAAADDALGSRIEGDMRGALAGGETLRREYRVAGPEGVQVWDARYVALSGAAGEPAQQLLLVASDVTEQRAAEQARLDAAIAQREMLVREVHHRIKNNLQGVAGLMQQLAQRRPELAAVVGEAVGQVHAIAQVYGLQVGGSGPLPVAAMLRAIAGSVQRMFGRAIEFEPGPAAQDWRLPESEAIPIALTVNELLTNALKHGGGSAVRCRVEGTAEGVVVAVLNGGALPAGFDLARVPGGISGLGLVRALLPRRHAALTLSQQGDEVLARLSLAPPLLVPPGG